MRVRCSISLKLGTVGLCLLCFVAAGCGPAQGEIGGTVKFNGKPVKSGSIMFVPKEGAPVYGVIKSDGTYTATNVPAGENKVCVNSPDPKPVRGGRGSELDTERPQEPAQPPPPPEVVKDWFPIPARFGDPVATQLTFIVKTGKNEFPIDLK